MFTTRLNNLRVSPQKVRIVTDHMRGMRVDDALIYADNEIRHVGPVIAKLLRSAIANADHNHKTSSDRLIVKDIQVGAGPTLKRFRARAYGRAAQILKRTSKIVVILSVVEQDSQKKVVKKNIKKETTKKTEQKKEKDMVKHAQKKPEKSIEKKVNDSVQTQKPAIKRTQNK